MSYRIEGAGPPRLLAGEVGRRTSYLSVGVADVGMPDEIGYDEDELEIEVLVQAAWVLRRDAGPIVLASGFAGCLPTRLRRIANPSELVKAGPGPRYSKLDDTTIAIPTSIPLLRYCLSVFGPPSVILSAGLGPDAARLAIVEDGLAIRGKVTTLELHSIADRTHLQLDTSDARISGNIWVIDQLDGYESWSVPYLAALRPR